MRVGQFVLLSWAVLIVLGLIGQMTHVGEKYAIAAVAVAILAAGVMLAMMH